MTDPSPEQPKLTPANQNPWYILMTLHGEQKEGARAWNFDTELHARNRRDWNKWAARGLSEARRAELLAMTDSEGEPRFDENELVPHDEKKFAALAAAFKKATGARGAAAALPQPGEVCDFEKVAFDRAFIARGLLFPGAAHLSGATFSGDANLSGATFVGDADLRGATFAGDAVLRGATFVGDADLRGATFAGVAVLRGATFAGVAGFEGATFAGDAFLSSATFSRKHFADFSRATFKGETTFLNAEMEGATSFAHAVFETHPPRFHGAKLNEGVAFHGVRWPDPPVIPVMPPRPLSDEERRKKEQEIAAANEYAQRHVYNYQRLKQIMEGLKKHEDELNFFAMEMAAQRVVDGKWSPRGALNGLYGVVSDYGRSIFKPSMWLTVVIIVSFAMLWFSTERQKLMSLTLACTDIPAGKALGLSLTSALGFLPLKKEIFGDLSGLSTAAHIWMGIETVLSFALLFLIGLGLRNRFRLK